MNKSTNQLNKKIARLETINDHLTTEMEYLDQLLRNIGFGNGLATVKAVAIELRDNNKVEKE